MESKIAGAIFDFAGFLTTREHKVCFGSSFDSFSMASLIKEWSSKRGLSIDNADVENWNEPTGQEFVSVSKQGLYEVLESLDYEIDDYEYRSDNGDYTPNKQERILITDFSVGLTEEFIEAICAKFGQPMTEPSEEEV